MPVGLRLGLAGESDEVVLDSESTRIMIMIAESHCADLTEA